MENITRANETINVPDRPSKQLLETAALAEEELGYKKLGSVLREGDAARDRLIARKKVMEALAGIGIEILNLKEVIEYKKQRLLAMNELRSGDKFKWEFKSLKEYQLPVPAFALERAVQVKKAIMAAGLDAPQFYVDQLIKEAVVVDPFMLFTVAQCGDKDTFYLDVWEEPAFEARRTI